MSDSIKSLTEEIRAFSDARGWYKNPKAKDMAISISIEAGELLEHFQWVKEEGIDTYVQTYKSEISDELADVVIYALQFADHNGIDLAEAIRTKMQKNAQKYPLQ